MSPKRPRSRTPPEVVDSETRDVFISPVAYSHIAKKIFPLTTELQREELPANNDSEQSDESERQGALSEEEVVTSEGSLSPTLKDKKNQSDSEVEEGALEIVFHSRSSEEIQGERQSLVSESPQSTNNGASIP